MCLWGDWTKRSPQRDLSAVGPRGLSGGIIDDVFITRCGLMWGLGPHSLCCGSLQVDSAASSLTTVNSETCTGSRKKTRDRCSLFSSLYHVVPHDFTDEVIVQQRNL